MVFRPLVPDHFGYERTRSSLHRGRPQRDLAGGLGRGGRGRDRVLSRQARGFPELPRHAGHDLAAAPCGVTSVSLTHPVRATGPGRAGGLGLDRPAGLRGVVREAQRALDRTLRLSSDRGRRGLAVLEEDHGRDRRDAVADRELLLLVDVHLDDAELAFALLRDAVEHGGDGVARAAPLGPEVDDHRRVALDHLGVEGLLSHWFGQDGVPFPGGRENRSGNSPLPWVKNAGEASRLPASTLSAMFRTLPLVPDHPALEQEVLEWWDREGTFEQLRKQNAGRPPWSFVDGPITANNPMGVHHAWGRTLKDVFQRYKALRGYDQRYQNGFDCQGLWVEVEVEKGLGLNSKREIEEYGLAEFAERCRERVAHFGEVITEQSRRLGMWMDWDNDYYTFSDTNIEYIWRFLRVCHERGWLYKGHRSTEWCPRCGTSISQHELFAGEYKELEHPSLFVRFPLRGREGEALVVWTTTPWTLPANVAAAVKPDAEYGLTADGRWLLVERIDGAPVRTVRGTELVGLEYEGPFDDLSAQRGVVHRVIPWDDVSLEEGTGIVHIAPGAGTEDFELSRIHGLPVLVPIDEAGVMREGYGAFTGLSTEEVEEPVIEELRRRELLVEAGRI